MFSDPSDELEEVFEQAFFSIYGDLGEDVENDLEENYCTWERFCSDSVIESPPDSNVNGLLYAGYVDCMDEAIRFLVEEENISPDHPIVKNLKTHLEKSKEKIIDNFAEFKMTTTISTDNLVREEFPSNPFFVQNRNESG